MKSRLLWLNLFLGLLLSSRVYGQELGEEMGEFGEEIGEEGAFQNEWTLNVVNSSIELISNISFRVDSASKSDKLILHYYQPTEDSISFLLMNTSGDVVTNYSVMEGGDTSGYLGTTNVNDLKLMNGNSLVCAGNSTGIYCAIVSLEDGSIVKETYMLSPSTVSGSAQMYQFQDGNILVLISEYTEDAGLEYQEQLYFHTSVMILDQDGNVVKEKFPLTDDTLSSVTSVYNYTESTTYPIIWVGSDQMVYGLTVTSTGEVTEPKMLSTNQATNINELEVFPDSKDALLVWELANEDRTRFDSYALIFNSETLDITVPETMIESSVTTSETTQTAIILPNGNIFFAWHHYPEDTTQAAAMGEIRDKNLEIVKPAFAANSMANRPDNFLLSFADIGIFSEKYLYMAWTANCTNTTENDGYTFWLAMYDFDGKLLFTDDLFDDCSTTRGLTNFYEFPSGDVTLFWRDPREGTSSNSSIYARMLSFDFGMGEMGEEMGEMA